MSAVAVFGWLARNNAWANHRLLGTCAGLDEEALRGPCTGFFPSLHATLNHILVVDWLYVDALEGGRLGPAATADATPCANVAALTREQTAVDARLLAYCARLEEAALAAPVTIVRADHDQVERVDRVLLHLFQHQIHHRGQAHAMLSGTALAPPQLDEFFLAEEAALRRADFAALGWREEEIWQEQPVEPIGSREGR
jgi:uncharacterized damage-inducible protein DinB